MKLYFPKLIKDKDGSNYKLDWNGFHQLPEPYEQQIQSLSFFLNESYLEEIVRVRKNAIHEWGLQRGHFDTSIREICLTPAITFSQIYFKLLWDRVMVESLQYQHWLQNTLMYKMWIGQTGGGCIFDNADMHRLHRLTDRFLTKLNDETITKYQHELFSNIQTFCSEIDKFRKNRFDLKNKRYWLQSPKGAYEVETYTSPFTNREE